MVQARIHTRLNQKAHLASEMYLFFNKEDRAETFLPPLLIN